MSTTKPEVSSAPYDEIEQHRPLLRGWIHTIAAPLSLAAAIVLVVLAPTSATRWASVVYMICSLMLFSTSAIYHRIVWGQKGDAILRRMDHSNIFLLIAGTYTPITVASLTGTNRIMLLSIVWGGAGIGILMRIFWLQAPRWSYTLIYILLGWVAIWFLYPIAEGSNWAVVWLLVSGGIVYTIGAIFYALRWPGPLAKIFGFHEFFHLCTLIGWTLMCVATYIAVLSA
ncbi:PAQR family membrane homeostasis protein TrhA [Boudabousia marimammalium]|uniref:Hemolysin n=1 Tax=Boudabousia marimammalium TaxID=156892 RepID=A0A1Q5PRV5_9ACTO|nr:hemolysin III family protein [Boudabousia marimammalium]OKL50263.1 hemolysin [Boudabousia marimammalium]